MGTLLAAVFIAACQPTAFRPPLHPIRQAPQGVLPVPPPSFPLPTVQLTPSPMPPSQIIGVENTCEAYLGPARNLCLLGRTRSYNDINSCLNATESFVPICQSDTAVYHKDASLCPRGFDRYSYEMVAFCLLRVQAALGNEVFCAGTLFDTPDKRQFCLAVIHNSKTSCPASGRLRQNCLMTLATTNHAVQTCELMGPPSGARGVLPHGDPIFSPLYLLFQEATYDSNLCFEYIAKRKQDPNLCNNIKPVQSRPHQKDECKLLINQ